RLARPIRCSGRYGPRGRTKAPAMLEDVLGSARRSVFSAPIVAALNAASTVGFIVRHSPTPAMNPACALEAHHDLAEHLPAFESRQAALQLVERDFRVDHRQQPAGHLVEAVADIAHRGAERPEDLVLLLKQLHQVEGDGRSRGRAAGDEAAAALEA